MPSTGTTSYAVTGTSLATAALRSMRVIIEGQAASASQLAEGIDITNMILKSWMTKGVKLWCYYQPQIPLQVGKVEYTIGPSGADVTSVRPLFVVEYGNFYRRVTGGVPYDTPLRLIGRMEYMQFGSKTSTGVPNTIYYSQTFDTGAVGGPTDPTGYGRLYVYVPSSDTMGTLFLNAVRYIFDVGNGTETIDMPPEAFLALKHQLMALWADSFEVPEDRIMRYIKMAEQYAEVFDASNVEQAPTSFGADMTGDMGSYS